MRDSWDKIILASVFFAGTIGGVAIKILHVHPFVAAGFSATLLVAYASFAFLTTRLRLEPEIVGDNCYYLGFLFTLTSLAVTLYFIVEPGVDTLSDPIPEVISGFGVALSSTIVGVFLRVLMMQFRVDLVSRERETKVSLDDAARSLRNELGQAVARFKAFSVETAQIAAEREVAIIKATDEATQSMRDDLVLNTNEMLGDIRASIQRQSNQAVEEIRKSVDAAVLASVESLRSAYVGLAKATDDIAHQNRSVALSSEEHMQQVNEHLATMRQASEGISAELEQLSNTVRHRSSDADKSVGELISRIGTATARLDSSARDGEAELRATIERLRAITKEEAASAVSRDISWAPPGDRQA